MINEPYQGIYGVRLVPLLDASLVEAIVNLTYEEPGYKRVVQHVFTPANIGSGSHQISIPTLTRDPAGYTYEVTVVRNDGSVFTSPPKTSDTRVAIVSDGEGQVRRINVKLLNPDLVQTGLAALKVDLTGRGDSPDHDSVLFTPSQVNDQTLTLVQPMGDGPGSYSFKSTGYTLQGSPIPGDSGESTDTTLLVRAPGA